MFSHNIQYNNNRINNRNKLFIQTEIQFQKKIKIYNQKVKNMIKSIIYFKNMGLSQYLNIHNQKKYLKVKFAKILI